jgi:hypothetical protein
VSFGGVAATILSVSDTEIFLLKVAQRTCVTKEGAFQFPAVVRNGADARPAKRIRTPRGIVP